MGKVRTAGMVLTGGRSRRMGRDKMALRIGPSGTPTFSEHTAAVLTRVCSPAVEIGPGHTALPASMESPAGGGPLVAVAAGWRLLAARGWAGPVVVVAADLPLLTDSILRWLVDHEGQGSVVPVAGGRVQPLCARYSPGDLDTAVRLVDGGARSMMAFLDEVDAHLAPEWEWAGPAGGAGVLADVDTPDDLRRVIGEHTGRDQDIR